MFSFHKNTHSFAAWLAIQIELLYSRKYVHFLHLQTVFSFHCLTGPRPPPPPAKTLIRPVGGVVLTSLFPSFPSACAFFSAVTNYAHINFYKTFLPLPLYFMFLFVTTASHTHSPTKHTYRYHHFRRVTGPGKSRQRMPFQFSSFQLAQFFHRGSVCCKNEEQFTLEKFQHAFLSCPKQLLYGTLPSAARMWSLFSFFFGAS